MKEGVGDEKLILLRKFQKFTVCTIHGKFLVAAPLPTGKRRKWRGVLVGPPFPDPGAAAADGRPLGRRQSALLSSLVQLGLRLAAGAGRDRRQSAQHLDESARLVDAGVRDVHQLADVDRRQCGVRQAADRRLVGHRLQTLLGGLVRRVAHRPRPGVALLQPRRHLLFNTRPRGPSETFRSMS